MRLTPGISISRGDVVTRQTIFDVLALAPGSIVVGSDLEISVRSIVSQTEPPTGAALFPGQVWFDQHDQLMKVWTDMLDGTGVSLWLSIGPDRFDTAMLAAEPLPFGAAVHLVGDGRRARLPSAPESLNAMAQATRDWEVAKVVGFNNQGTRQSPSTAASGAWFACAVDGIPWAWLPYYRESAGVVVAARGGRVDLMTLTHDSTLATKASGVSDVRGAIVWDGSNLDAGNAAVVAVAVHRVPQFGDLYARVLFSGPRITRHI